MALAAAVSNLSFTWVAGIDPLPVRSDVGEMEDDTKERRRFTPAQASWAAHMRALEIIAEENLDSALIMEDDVDWDVRLGSQMETFGEASRSWLRRLDESRARETGATRHSRVKGGGHTCSSPYGRGWDVLWLGHCGTGVLKSSPAPPPPPRKQRRPRLSPRQGQGRDDPTVLRIPDDPTVPAPRHLRPHPFAGPDALAAAYPPHTRLVHAAGAETTCTLAYAVSGPGARRLLARFGTGDAGSSAAGAEDRMAQTTTAAQWDLTLGAWCGGADPGRDRVDDHDADPPVCLTVQPPLISHHYPRAGGSDIQGLGGGYVRGKVGSPYIRWSVRMNLRSLVLGHGTEDEMVDQWSDDGDTVW